MAIDLLPQFIRDNFEVREWKHACAVLSVDFPDEWRDICEVFTNFRIYRNWLTTPGGNKSEAAKWIDRQLVQSRGWQEKQFQTSIVVDNATTESPTHQIDCFKNQIALEVEWNNKDPFYDRDLNNFRLLFDLRAVSVGVIVTRTNEIADLAVELGRRRGSYGQSTTHWDKLIPRIEGGGGAGCPILALGMKRSLFVDQDENP